MKGKVLWWAAPENTLTPVNTPSITYWGMSLLREGFLFCSHLFLFETRRIKITDIYQLLVYKSTCFGSIKLTTSNYYSKIQMAL